LLAIDILTTGFAPSRYEGVIRSACEAARGSAGRSIEIGTANLPDGAKKSSLTLILRAKVNRHVGAYDHGRPTAHKFVHPKRSLMPGSRPALFGKSRAYEIIGPFGETTPKNAPSEGQNG
jgi:hypothetical protein